MGRANNVMYLGYLPSFTGFFFLHLFRYGDKLTHDDTKKIKTREVDQHQNNILRSLKRLFTDDQVLKIAPILKSVRSRPWNI